MPSKSFRKGELVWSKIKGFPWWPSIISKIIKRTNSEAKILVNFIGDSTHAEIPLSKIEKYDEKYSFFSKVRSRSLSKSILLANKIKEGEEVFEEKHELIGKIEKESDSQNISEVSELSEKSEISVDLSPKKNIKFRKIEENLSEEKLINEEMLQNEKEIKSNDGFKELLSSTYLSLGSGISNSKIKPIIENLTKLKEKIISFEIDLEFYNIAYSKFNRYDKSINST